MSCCGVPNRGAQKEEVKSGPQVVKQVPRVPGPDSKAQEESKWDKYNKCGFMDVIQHIDIHGKFQTCYSEMKRRKLYSPLAISVCSRVPSNIVKTVDAPIRSSTGDRLGKMSTITKTCSLYPGHDILSKRFRGRSESAKKNLRNFTCALAAR